MEFCLPDQLPALHAVEAQLRTELRHREADYQVVVHNYPPNLSPHKTPAYYAMLVAHRRWQFAYEKLLMVQGRGQKA